MTTTILEHKAPAPHHPLRGAGYAADQRLRATSKSDVPAGAACLALLAAHDLDVTGRLDLALIYGPPAQRGSGADAARVRRPEAAVLLGEVHFLWLALHNAVAGRLVGRKSDAEAAWLARAITRNVYRSTLETDMLEAWMMPRFRRSHAAPPVGRSAEETRAAFRDGIGHLAARMLERGAPFGGPVSDDADWLDDFARYFAIGSSVPRRLPAIGPLLAVPGVVSGGEAFADGLVLHDVVAQPRGDQGSIGDLIERANRREPGVFEGCFVQDERHLGSAVRARGAGLARYLMREADADTGGRTLGALGSTIMREAMATALAATPADEGLDPACREVFGGEPPRSMAGVVRFLNHARRAGYAPLAA